MNVGLPTALLLTSSIAININRWALGVVIYEMLAGYPPFYHNTPFEIYKLILKGEPTYPSHMAVKLCACPRRPTLLHTAANPHSSRLFFF